MLSSLRLKQLPSKPSVCLFSNNLFSASPHQEYSRDPRISRLVAQARRQLKAQAGKAYGVLSPEAREDTRIALSEFLVRLLLWQPDSGYVQQVIKFWVNAQAEMLHRLQLDRIEIEKHLSQGHSCEKLKAVALDLSDRHSQGRSVAVLTFDSGLKVVYKPRETSIEKWYFQTLACLNQIGAPLPFATLKVLSRPTYGWVQFIPHRRCRSKEEITWYYRNAGALLCVLYVLGATDCHFQNFVACFEYPVMVDAEMLFQPGLSDSELNSVVRTGMVPQWIFGPQGQAYDVSALGCVVPRSTHLLVPKWDGTEVGFEFGVLVPCENVPFSLTDPFTPQSYVDEMVRGFSDTYRFLAYRRQHLIRQIHKAQGLRIRYLIRGTVEYYEAISEMLHSKSGGGIKLKPLPQSHAVFDPLQQDEVQALERLDIPRFTLPANSRNLSGVQSCFTASGFEVAANLIKRLCEQDLERQAKFLRLAWGLSRVSELLQ